MALSVVNKNKKEGGVHEQEEMKEGGVHEQEEMKEVSMNKKR